MKWNGWLIAAVVCLGVAVWNGAINDTGYLVDGNTPSGYVNVDCGTLVSPKYPRDGRGPCTDALEDRQTIVIVWTIAAAILGVVGWSRATKASKA